ncbi:MAG: aminotransferase class I/II-fold pyridoxal phosphate-dependent enzyme [Deltaproteobacteria bacterium]|nr:aminotransferase class I/II-fold pyridoxal phosphate-dependent enzyme [Deltaproteobacteria bacterium]
MTEIESCNLAAFCRDSAHGGDVWGAARRLGLPVEEIIDLSASLNPLGPPPGMDQAILEALPLICHYPDRLNWELRNTLSEHLNVPRDHVLPAAGSTALIRMMARIMDLRNIVVVAPVFGEFSRSLAVAGRHFRNVVIPEKQDFRPGANDLERIWAEDTSCVIITNPVTPAGGLIDLEVLDALVEQAEKRRAWIILDEAYIDFAPEEYRNWAPSRVDSLKSLVVMRSMTKFYCLAGLRLGYALAHPQTLTTLAAQGQPWSVHTLAQAAGVHCLGQAEYAEKTRSMNEVCRKVQAGDLAKLGCKVYPSQANYLLCRLDQNGPNAAYLAQEMEKKAILVRDASTFTGCGEHHLRVAVTSPERWRRFLEAYQEIIGSAQK